MTMKNEPQINVRLTTRAEKDVIDKAYNSYLARVGSRDKTGRKHTFCQWCAAAILFRAIRELKRDPINECTAK